MSIDRIRISVNESIDSCPPSPTSSIDSAIVTHRIPNQSQPIMSKQSTLSKELTDQSIITFESATDPTMEGNPSDIPIFRPTSLLDSPRRSRQSSSTRSNSLTPSHSPTPRSPNRHKRIPLNHSQKMILETFYSLNQYPNRSDKHELSERIGLDVDKVHKWFDNRRTKANKDRKGGVEFHYAPNQPNAGRPFSEVAAPLNNPANSQNQALNWYALAAGQQSMPNQFNQSAPLNQSMQQFNNQPMTRAQTSVQPFMNQAGMPQSFPPSAAFDMNIQNMQLQAALSQSFPMQNNNQPINATGVRFPGNNQPVGHPMGVRPPLMMATEAFNNMPQFGGQQQFGQQFEQTYGASAPRPASNSMAANPIGTFPLQPPMVSQPFINCSTLPPPINTLAPQWFNIPVSQPMQMPSFMQQSGTSQPMNQAPQMAQQIAPLRPDLLPIPQNTGVSAQSKPRSPISAFSIVQRKNDMGNPSVSPPAAASTAVKRTRVEVIAGSSQADSSKSSPSTSHSNSNRSSTEAKQSPTSLS